MKCKLVLHLELEEIEHKIKKDKHDKEIEHKKCKELENIISDLEVIIENHKDEIAQLLEQIERNHIFYENLIKINNFNSQINNFNSHEQTKRKFWSILSE